MQTCALTRITTDGAIPVGADGVKVADSPGGSDFEIYEYVDNQLKEYSKPGVVSQPLPFTALDIYTTIKEHAVSSAYRMKFTTN